jgi:putative membrane protein insertion efficiency factor
MLSKIAVCALRFYQVAISGLLPSSCRFTPTCSEYARQALLKYGFFWGAWKAAKRLCSCHPFSAQASDDPLV